MRGPYGVVVQVAALEKLGRVEASVNQKHRESHQPLCSSKPVPCAHYMQHLLFHGVLPSKQMHVPAAMARLLGRGTGIKATCCYWDKICPCLASKCFPASCGCRRRGKRHHKELH